METLKNTFSKAERLCSQKDIETLYKTGKSLLVYPVVFYYLPDPDSLNSRLLVSVSKKKFKRAVDRNLLKRRLREVYRLNKTLISYKFIWGMVYIAPKILEYSQLEKAFKEAIRKISSGIEQRPGRTDSPDL